LSGKEPVVETLVGEITSASIFETLLANEFGNKSAPDKDEVDGTVKQQPQPITSKQPVKQSSGTDILYGCHLLLDVCIIYFISCDCIMNSSFLNSHH
jgi:hypothetical protein